MRRRQAVDLLTDSFRLSFNGSNGEDYSRMNRMTQAEGSLAKQFMQMCSRTRVWTLTWSTLAIRFKLIRGSQMELLLSCLVGFIHLFACTTNCGHCPLDSVHTNGNSTKGNFSRDRLLTEVRPKS